ncbi:hypothetical protein CH272_08425 [Rhodococcus sp. 05-340-1]|nr:hypothetical protein CH271_17590 [Rhodococcus sp. 05-340-2]OZD81171.1 hypothetical protein CH272_08425 [Rhodococcus sp. 05-340-1]OZF02439.1 hypothetical protein CH302_07070 [Rhodococcus sp. 15-2388-1-1a]OZF27836.1 hypothetical protein CH295_22775 [Rhodococcus sp. 14-2483-1-2]
MAGDPRPGDSGSNAGPVALDLVSVEFLAPRLRKIIVGSAAIGILLAVVLALFAPVWVAVLVGVIVGGPAVLSGWLGLRRRVWLDGPQLCARGLRTRRLKMPEVVTAELTIRTAGIDQISLRLYDGRTHIVLPLALYTRDGGRELPILALRTLADSLWTTELVPAAAIASVLVDQLRAEARDAGLDQRPLYRAVELVRSKGRTPQATLTDREVAQLLD